MNPHAMVPNELIDAEELGRRLSLKTETVMKLARRGVLPCLRLGRKVIRFDYVEVVKAMGQHREE